MTPLHFPSFQLRDDFHQEVGWQDLARDLSFANPATIRCLLAHRDRIPLGRDPVTALQRWEPVIPGFMFYAWMWFPGDRSPSFVMTDSWITFCFRPLPQDEHLMGLPDDLFALSQEVLTLDGGHEPKPSPLWPLRPKGTAGAPPSLPELMVVHRYPISRATLRPCADTLQALSTDPQGWLQQEPRLPTLRG